VHDVQAYMGHADIQTTMIYVHHQPKASAADKLSQLVTAATGAEGVSPTVSRTAENGAQLSATTGHRIARKYCGCTGLAATHNPSRAGSSPARAIEIAR
jgi:hypothetical protein